jgi:hypothetical protein
MLDSNLMPGASEVKADAEMRWRIDVLRGHTSLDANGQPNTLPRVISQHANLGLDFYVLGAIGDKAVYKVPHFAYKLVQGLDIDNGMFQGGPGTRWQWRSRQ